MKTSLKNTARVLRYLKPYWGLSACAGMVIVTSGLIGLLAPWPIKLLVDNVLSNHPLSPGLSKWLGSFAHDRVKLLAVVVAVGILITFTENILSVISNYVQTKLEQKMILDFRSDLFEHAQRLSLAFHDQRRSGSLIYAINFQADAAAGLIMTIPPLVHSALSLVGMFWISLTIDPKLAWLSLTVVPFLYYSVHYYSTRIQDRLMHVKNLEGESLSIIHEAVSMLRVIVAFGRERHEHSKFRAQGELAVDERVKVTVRQTLFTLAVNMTTAMGSALVLAVGAYHALQGKLTTGQLLVIIAYIAAVYKPLESISYTVGSLQDKFVNLKIAFGLLDTAPEIYDAPHSIDIPGGRARGDVRFEDVNFSYTKRVDTLRNIAFHASPGEVIAVVGPTGAGKTTLISLIPRFYAPTSGRITIDGTDITRLTLKSLREQISIVLQEPLLFSGSIFDNIRYGRLDATEAEIIEAARGANAHEFILRLPDGYKTLIGERGVQLSGGERQRIAVARAFLKNAPILILDEPTSSIDSKTEAVILDALDRLMIGRTTFMIAHRLSTVRRADKILVLDQGRMVEQGPHDELMSKRGLYRQLHDIQTKSAERLNKRLLDSESDKSEDEPTAGNAVSLGVQ